MCVVNRSFAYIMVRNLESNFLKIFNQSEDRNRSGRKRKDGRQSKWNTNKYWKWSDLEAQRKGSCSWFFMMVSTFCILIILEEFARSFGEIYSKNCRVVLVQILFFSFKNNISSVAKYWLEVKAQIYVVDFSDQAFAFDMHQEYYMIYIRHFSWSN